MHDAARQYYRKEIAMKVPAATRPLVTAAGDALCNGMGWDGR